MSVERSFPGPLEVVTALLDATNLHDLEALTACFAPDYRLEMPAHPDRSFRGVEQVRRNWSMFFTSIPDLSARILAAFESGPEVWSEWEMTGTRNDGSRHEMRGVMIFTVSEGLIRACRFYLEPVERGTGDIDRAVRSASLGGPS